MYVKMKEEGRRKGVLYDGTREVKTEKGWTWSVKSKV